MLHIWSNRLMDTVVVKLDGELDHHTAGEAREKLDSLIEDPTIKNMVIDLKKLNFMDSSGIGVFIGRYKILARRGGKLSAINVNLHISKIFELSGLSKIISIYDNIDDAIKGMRRCNNGNIK